MRKLLINLLIFVIILNVIVFIIPTQTNAYVKVRGYFRKDGTYVRPYVRSNPNALRYDNYNYNYRRGGWYNSSYYYPTENYSSNWYTPSSLTDPDYYRGKIFYDLRDYSYPSY